MNEKYYRITAYYEIDNFTIIIDSNGLFDKLWQFSSSLIQKGFQIIEVSKEENFIDINIEKAPAKLYSSCLCRWKTRIHRAKI